jgi:hypothetical protein
MRYSHPLCVITIATLAIAIAVSTPVWAYSEHQLDKDTSTAFKSPEPIVQLAMRKSTRDDRADNKITPEPPQSTQDKIDGPISAATHLLEGCMAIWDADTHITRSRWKENCKRQIKELEALPDV